MYPTLVSLWSPRWCGAKESQSYTQCSDHSSPFQAQRKYGKQSLVAWQRLHFWICTRRCGRGRVVSGKHTWKSENFAGENIFPSFVVLLCISSLLGNSLMPLLCIVRLCWLKRPKPNRMTTFGSALPLGSCFFEHFWSFKPCPGPIMYNWDVSKSLWAGSFLNEHVLFQWDSYSLLQSYCFWTKAIYTAECPLHCYSL